MVLVAGVTVATNLATAVVVGVIVSALVFAWKTAGHIYVDTGVGTTPDRHVYNLHGQLFFASVSTFKDLFNPNADPAEIVINFQDSRVGDHSGMEAILDLARRYDRSGKRLHLLNLSEDCQKMLKKANVIVDDDRETDTDNGTDAKAGLSHRVAITGLGGSGEEH